MAAKKEKQGDDEIDFEKTQVVPFSVGILGAAPLICNRMSEKARQTLLLGGERVNAAARAARLKHDPYEEFRASPYTLREENSSTYIAVMASSFKKAMATAALDLPGQKSSQIKRLVHIMADQNLVPIYGVPELFMSVTRSSDMNHTPDIRTRAILPRWGAIISVAYVSPLLKERSVISLLQTAGITAGIGDWRPEKGSGNYGQFTLVPIDNPELQLIMAQGERDAQLKAIANPHPYDDDTERLLKWFSSEAIRRGFEPINAMAVVGAAIDDLGINGNGHESAEE